MKRLWC